MAHTPPIPPPPPKNHDILPLFLKDPHSVDVCFVFPDDKTFPNHGLWAHRLVLSRNKVFVKMIDDAVQQATVAATQTRLVSSIQEDDNSSATSSSYTDIGGQEGDSGSGTSPTATVATLSDSGDIKDNKQSNNTFVFNFTKSAADINTAKATAFTGFGTGAGAETAAAATRTTFGASWIIGTGPGGSGGFGTGTSGGFGTGTSGGFGSTSGGFGTGASGGFGSTTSGGFGAGTSGGWNTGTWGTLGADTRPTLETSTFGASTLGAPTLGASALGTSTLESVTGSSLGSGLGASTGSSLGAGLGAETGSKAFDSVSPTTTNAGKGPSTLTLTIKKFSLETFCALLQFIYTGDSSCTIQTSQFVLSANSPGLDQPLSRDSASIRWMVDNHQGLQKWVPMVKDEDLMLAAHEYGVSDLAAICQTRVEELMSESNIGHILFEVAPQYSKIKAPALAYVVSNNVVLFAAGKDIFASYRSHPQCHAIMMEIFQLMASSK
ncbi:hypothetical protein BGX33_002288 [Mortierella sp. NVP41]|nr:hypothetical protein BGX33_002288 [Mortierella sp. NVP41]